ncbi:PQQ-dependent sugar dehydrogenase [Marinobacter panjinensis]|nr:PQQ-dependent sugar dehydrogenase [Marinobacter panjinensis]MCR8915410.1 PQQ-dependent sugar dehydrogenase [Marinobacter panjinensis]
MRDVLRRYNANFSMSLLAGTLALSTVAGAQEALDDPIPEPIDSGHVRIVLETSADGMTAPNWGSDVPGCTNLQDRLVVSDQDGILWAVNIDTGDRSVLLDVSDRLVSLGVGGPGTFDERGLLGFTFHPDFANNGLLYTYTSEPVAGPADFSTMPVGVDANHQSVINEWRVPAPSCERGAVVDPTSRRELLRIDEPQFNHNGGTLAFGPYGMLYISLGDGGAADDQGVGHVPGGNGQDPGNVLGTILRIDPQGSNAANGQYGVPVDNPFVGDADAVDEIFAYGFRNPFRFSFDAYTGEMMIADVGQNDIEEVDVGVPGGNYGWPIKEGSFCFHPNGTEPGFVFNCGPGNAPAGLVEPVAVYDHDEGIAVIGGFVYRGSLIPNLMGRYVFGDYLQPYIDSGRLFYLGKNDRIFELDLRDRDSLGLVLLGFGQDAFGELYVLANETGTPFGDTGVVLRMVNGQGKAPNRFRTHLSGSEEVPATETRAQGQATFEMNRTANHLSFRLIVANIEGVVAAHIHCAPEGVNGPVGVTLFSGGPVSPDGTLASGNVSEPGSGNACGWGSIGDVLTAMRLGNAYVNVHTLANPPGEIRGQIR